MKYLDNEKKHLLFFSKYADESFWNLKWVEKWNKKGDNFYSTGTKSLIRKITPKFLNPEDGPILEGGCGLGDNVFYLNAMNYDIIGIDYAEIIIKKINKELPQLKIQHGDVRQIPYSDNFFAGYWSFGVIEHYLRGYFDIIKEMKRVIKPKGYLFITFPYMSPFRLFKSKINLYKTITRGYEKKNELAKKFYQFALNKERVIKDLEEFGFKLKYMESYSGIKGFKDEIFIFKFFLKRFFQLLYDCERPKFLLYLKGLLNKLLAKKSGHDILLVLQKNNY